MSWPQVAIIASTAFSAIQTYKSQKAESAFGMAQANIARTAALDKANMAKIQGAQQEVARLRDYQETRSYNLNQQSTDIMGPSFLALQEDNKKIRDESLSRIQLQSLASQRSSLLGAYSAEVEGQAYRYMGSQAAFAAGGKLLKGGTQLALLS